MKQTHRIQILATFSLLLAMLAGLSHPVLAEPPPPPVPEGGSGSGSAAEQPRPPRQSPDEVADSSQAAYLQDGQLVDVQGNPVVSAQGLAVQAQMVNYVQGCPPGVLPKWLGGTGLNCTLGNITVIQDAINDGKVLSGWTVWAPAGTYAAGFDVHKSISVSGQQTHNTILQNNVFISNANVTLSNFSILGGQVNAEGNSGLIRLNDLLVDPPDGNIAIEIINHSGSVSLTNVTATGAYSGALIDVTAGSGTVTILNSSFSGNNGNCSAFDDYGLEIHAINAVKLDNVVVSNNRCSDGVYIEYARNLTIRNSLFDRNGLGNNPLLEASGYGLQAFDIGLTPGPVSLANLSASNNRMGGATVIGGGAVTLDNAVFRGNLNDSGLLIDNSGAITLNRVDASENGMHSNFGDGAVLFSAKAGLTRVTNSLFNDNAGFGLYVDVLGAVTMRNILANRNETGSGVSVSNQPALSAQPVSLTALIASDNGSMGIEVFSRGSVTLNALVAGGNGANGLFVENCMLDFDTNRCAYTAGVTLSSTLGANLFTGNTENGLSILSGGTITLNGLSASRNSGNGALIDNVGGVGNISITNGIFNANDQRGLGIDSRGSVALLRVNANDNDLHGATIGDAASTAQPRLVTLTSSTFDRNTSGSPSDGLAVLAAGAVSLNHVSASGNSGGTGALLTSSLGAVSVLGTLGANAFSNNYGSGLVISGRGNLAVRDTTASGNGGGGVNLNNAVAPSIVTAANLRAEGNNNDGLVVTSWGSITLSRVISSGSLTGSGALLNNLNPGGAPIVTITQSEFDGNFAGGLSVDSKGSITLNHVSASGSLSGPGAALDNCQSAGGGICAGSGNISLLSSLGANNFDQNKGSGLKIDTRGIVIINGTSASENANTGFGAWIANHYALNPVTISGSSFNHNEAYGLKVESKGTLTLRGVLASWNLGGSGASLDNSAITGALRAVSISSSVFSGNSGDGLAVTSKGNLTLNAIIASGNSGRGADLDACLTSGLPCEGSGAITLLNTLGENHFDNNFGYGLHAVAKGAITLNSLTVNGTLLDGSPTGGAYLSNADGIGDIRVQNGQFNGLDSIGLEIRSSGAITLLKVNASDNLLSGAVLSNETAALSKPVTISSSNFDRNSGDGLEVRARGALTLNNISASGNGGFGANLDTCLANPACTSAGTLSILSTLGANRFNNNGKNGLKLDTNNTVILSKVSLYANGSTAPGYAGLEITHRSSAAVTLSCSIISGSGAHGILATLNGGTLLLRSVMVSGNQPPAGQPEVSVTNGSVTWSRTTCN